MVDIKAKIQQKTQLLQQKVKEHNDLNQAIDEATVRRDNMRTEIAGIQGALQMLQELDAEMNPEKPEEPKAEEPKAE